MAILQYRFLLKVGAAAYVDVHPRRDNEAAIVTAGEEKEMYFRDRLQIKLTFQREDFTLINSAAFDTEFLVQTQEIIAGIWTLIDTSRFYKTDCTFDIDNETIEVSPATFDIYEDVLNGIDSEFDLIALEPPTVLVNYVRQATFQVYFPGASFISSFLDGVWFEEAVSPFATTPDPGDVGTDTNHLAMLNDYGFGLGTGYNNPTDGLFNWARVVIPGDGLSPDVSGVYKAQSYEVDGRPILTTVVGTSYIREDGVYAIVNDATPPPGQIRQYIRRVSDNVIVYDSPLQTSPWSPFGQPPHSSPNQLFTSTTSADTCEAYLFLPYVRLLTNEETVGGDATILLPTDDQFPNGNFLRALPIDTLNFEFSAESSTTPTRWGKVSDDAIYFVGEYFVKPTMAETLMPVGSTTWTAASAWFWLDTALRDLQQEASEPITIHHAYKLADVISAILAEIGSTATHEDDPAFSDFLYATSNAIRGSRLVPVITPKSNVLIGDYDQAAQKAPIRFSEVLQLLRHFHNAFWHIDSEDRFIVEHRYYYDNGKTYGVTPVVGTDLTTALEPRTGLAWGYRTSKYKYEKADLPERLEFAWMDKVSQPFDGYPIQVISDYVQKGLIDQRLITKFTSDIDFFNVAASDISKDGFVFLEVIEDGDLLTVPFLEITIAADESYKLQNGYASFLHAHSQYHTYGLPATSVNLNREDITADSTIRSKIQEVEIALSDTIDPYELIESNLGVGRAVKIEKNLSSKTLKITIAHETE